MGCKAKMPATMSSHSSSNRQHLMDMLLYHGSVLDQDRDGSLHILLTTYSK